MSRSWVISLVAHGHRQQPNPSRRLWSQVWVQRSGPLVRSCCHYYNRKATLDTLARLCRSKRSECMSQTLFNVMGTQMWEERYPHQWSSCKNSLYMAISSCKSTLMIIWLVGWHSLSFLHSFPFFQECVLETISGIPFSKNCMYIYIFFPASRNS